jgi:hypothetical protein
MHSLATLMVASATLAAAGASAQPQTVPVIDRVSAGYSRVLRHTIVIQVTADLPNSCWSNPRLRPNVTGPSPRLGIVGFAVQADVKSGVMCAQAVQTVSLPRYNWRTYPRGVRSIRVEGSQKPVTALIRRTAG